MSVQLEPADIFLTRGTGWLSAAIRFFTRNIGESRTRANHVGLVVEGGPIEEAVVVEGLSVVRRHRLHERYGGSGAAVAIYRPSNLSTAEKHTVVEKAGTYVGKTYGYGKVVAHLLDWILQGAYVFRRLTNDPEYPICSWIVAHSFGAIGKHFGLPAGAASPDDIHDFVVENSDKYATVRNFGPLE